MVAGAVLDRPVVVPDRVPGLGVVLAPVPDLGEWLMTTTVVRRYSMSCFGETFAILGDLAAV